MKLSKIKAEFPDIRKINWALIIACFFLPAVRGCRDEVIIPYQHTMQHPDWTIPLTYLYPLILAAVAWLVFRFLKEHLRYGVLWGILYAIALSVTFVLFEIVRDLAWPIEFGGSIVLIWGVLFLGLARCKDPGGLLRLLAFTLTALSLWYFPVRCLFVPEVLVGGWLFIFASVTVLLTFTVEFFQKRNRYS